MDTEKTFEDLVRDEAYRIYEWRTFFNPPFPGDELSDYYEALDNIREEKKTMLITSRIKDLT